MPYSRYSHPRPKSKTKKRSKKKRSTGTAKPTDGSNASGEVLTDCETSEACSSSQYTESTLPASSENTLGCEEDKGASTDNEFDDSCFMKAVDKALSDVNKLDAIQTDVDCCGTGGEDGGTLTPIAGDLNGSSCTSIATEEDLIENLDGCSTEINKPMQKGVDASAEVKNSTVFSLIKNSLVITKECHNAIEKKAQRVAQEIPQCGESVVAAKPKNLNGLVKEHHLYKSMMCDDFVAYNTAAIKDAELAYFSRVTKSSESTEEKAKAAPEKSAKPSKSNGKSGNKSAAAAPAAAEKVWTNKAECEAAEAKLQERLAQGEYRNAANGERTFIMLKPDAVHRGLVGTIMDRFESRGFKLLAAKFMKADDALLREHYADLSKKGFFGELIRYMGSGPVVPMVWQGLNAVKQGRAMLGATNPKDSAPGTIRGDYCVDVGRNIIHGSDSVESAEKEIALWFSPAEISSWRSVMTEWVYEEEELQKPSAAALQESAKVDGLVAQSSEVDMALASKLSALELENKTLKKDTDNLKALIKSLTARVAALEGGKPAAAPAPADDDDDEDVDLFGSDDDDEEDAEKARVTAERLKAYAEKKSKKPALIAKTSVLFDIKPWDDETDMDAMLKACKSVEMDGLVWGANKLVPVGYGINKLQLMCVVEDEKVSIDELQEKICEFEDFVQSVDVAAMNKI